MDERRVKFREALAKAKKAGLTEVDLVVLAEGVKTP